MPYKKGKVQEYKNKTKKPMDKKKKPVKEILEPMLKETPPTADYDSPSWAFKQADRIGYNRALTQVLDIINLDKE